MNRDIAYDDEMEEEEINTDNNNQSPDNFMNIQKAPMDINFESYHSTLNFIDHLCDIINEVPKHPIEEQMLFL